VSDTDEGPRCSHCGKLECEPEGVQLFRCGACKQRAYCSRECQQESWLAGHRQECKELKELRKARKRERQRLEQDDEERAATVADATTAAAVEAMTGPDAAGAAAAIAVQRPERPTGRPAPESAGMQAAAEAHHEPSEPSLAQPVQPSSSAAPASITARYSAQQESAPAITALHMAALRGRLPTLLALLATGAGTADVNARFDDGDTPLHMACSAGSAAHVACAAALLDAGAEVDATDEDGITPLSLAAYEGSNELVQLLLVRGANPLLADADGRTPYDKARQMSHGFVASLLAHHMSLQRGSAGRAGAAGCGAGAAIASTTAQAGVADAGAAALVVAAS